MSNEVMKQKVRQALNEELAHIHTTSLERDQLYENAIGGKVMKHKLKPAWCWRWCWCWFQPSPLPRCC